MELLAGTVVDGRYHVVRLLGSGGMARVYAARDERLGVEVALKVLSLPSASIRERLVQEGRVQAALKHPNVLSVTDIVDIGGAPGLVMELVDGPSLDALIEASPPDAVEAEHLARGILEGVRAAHELGVVHRDLKPANVLLARVGGGLLPKVADFGLVKLLHDTGGMTRSGVAMGTPQYMAPEQVRDSKTVDQRADIFSLGAILYELFAGEPAFEGSDTYEIFNALVEGRFVPLVERVDVPDRVAAAVAGALQPDREQRLESVDALLHVLNGGVAVPQVSWRPELLAAVESLSRPSMPALRSSRDETWAGLEEASVVGSTSPVSATNSPTPRPPSPAASPRSVAAVSKPSPSRRLPWVAALGVAGMVALGGIWATRADPPRPFTSERAPSVEAQATQRLLDQAWTEYLANEEREALTHVQQALDSGATDPELFLLAAALEVSFWDFEGMAAYVEQGVSAAGTEEGPVPSLLRELDQAYRGAEDRSWWSEVLGAHLRQYPEDALAAFLDAQGMVVVPAHVPLQVSKLERLIEQHPDAIAAWVLEIDALRREGQVPEALVVADRALARHPNSAALHAQTATCAVQIADYPLAVAEGQAALRIDPSYWQARLMAAVGSLSMGQQAEFERLVAPMTGPETQPVNALRFGRQIARVLAKRGRLREAAVWWGRYEEATKTTGDPAALMLGLADQVLEATHPWMATDEELERRLRRLDAAVADPTLVASARRGPGLVSVFAHGLLSARSGALDDARDASVRVLSADPTYAERIDAELDRGDPAAMSDREGGCWSLSFRSARLVDAGAPAAGALLEQVSLQCPALRLEVLGLAAAGRVLLARKVGDRDAEEAAAAQFESLWRRPDPDLPISRALSDPTSLP